jgi:hypothetical protein
MEFWKAVPDRIDRSMRHTLYSVSSSLLSELLLICKDRCSWHAVSVLQLRLSDGTRMVARFNTTHTVADIRGFIDAARPGGSGPYQLQTMGFPPVKLTNPTQTIEGAGLLNAVVIQKG